MKPIASGTLCIIVNPRGDAYPSVVGKTTTVRGIARKINYACSCGCEAYEIDPLFVPEIGLFCDGARRHALQPILPPGVDTCEPVVNLLPEPVV